MLKSCSVLLIVTVVGCTTPMPINLSNADIANLKDTDRSATYAFFGGDVNFNENDDLYHITVFLGGGAGCGHGAIVYAKPKLDEYMVSHNFASYVVTAAKNYVAPIRKCEIFVRYDK